MLRDGCHEIVDRRVCECAHLFVGAVLDRVSHEDARRAGTDGARLRISGVDELVGRHEDGGDS